MKSRLLPIIALSIVCAMHAGAQSAGTALARALNDQFAGVYETVSPSVVVVEVTPSEPRNPWFFPRLQGGWDNRFADLGSGLILRTDGYIVTNHHVVAEAGPDGILVVLKDDRRLPATMVGFDARTDLAVLKVEADGLPAAEFADSDAVRVGQFAFAIGAPMELPYSFTFGLVSATGRSDLVRRRGFYEDFIQTDAAINPGNSGGPLADIDGQVIGINTLISGMNRGLGFAIPSNMVREVAGQLIERGRVIRPWLGIGIEGIVESERLRSHFAPLESGVVVQSVFRDAPASRSELQLGDVILAVDGRPVGKASDVQKAVLSRAVGELIRLNVWRQGATRTIEIAAGEQPERLQAHASPMLLPPAEKQPDAKAQAAPQRLPVTAADLGIEVQELTPEMLAALAIENDPGGVIVTEIKAESPAAAAGLEVGDVITAVGGNSVRSTRALLRSLAEIDPERGIMLLIVRGGERSFCILKP